MDLFLDGGFVRLRSRARDNEYVHADEDGVHVTLRRLGAVPSLNAVWKVDHWTVEGGEGNDVLLRLQGAAYGRYLAMARGDEVPVPPSGVRGVCAVQRDYDMVNLDPPFMWAPYRVKAGKNCVRLHNGQRCLRANGRYLNWNKLVSVEVRNGDKTKMMQWRVEAVPASPEPLPLPPPPLPPRRIWHFRLKDDGNPVTDDWPSFFSHDNSLANLRAQVARLENEENITLGVRAGYNARVIPLVTNLPNNTDNMQIIVYTTGSPAAVALTYPQLLINQKRRGVREQNF